MGIASEEDFQRAAKWAQANPSDPRRSGVIAELRKFDESRPKTDPSLMGQQGGSAPLQQGVPRSPLDTLPDINEPRKPDSPPGTAAMTFGDELKQTIGAPVGQAAAGIMGLADFGATVGSGMLASIPAGLHGLLTGLSDPHNLERASNAVRSTGEDLTWSPKSEAGKEVGRALGGAIEKVDQTVQDIAGYVSGGNPEAAMTIYTIVNAPFAASAIQDIKQGARYASSRAAKEAIDAAKTKAIELGIVLGSPKMDQQIGRAAEGIQAGASRGENIAGLGNDLRDARNQVKGAEDLQYSIARNGPKAYVDKPYFQQLKSDFNNILLGYDKDVRDAPRVQTALSRLESYATDSVPTAVSLNELDLWRRQLKNGLPSSKAGYSGVDKAMLELKGGLDEFLQSKLDDGLLYGDPEALKNWKSANGVTKFYYDNFRANKNVYKLLSDKAATPEEMRNYIFGSSELGQKQAATDVVRKIKTIFGEDSPQFKSLQMEFLTDALEPLRGNKPDVAKFVKYYETSFRKNKSLMDELMPYETRKLENLYKISKAATNAGGPTTFGFSIPRLIARLGVGSSIARHGAAVATTATILESLFGRSQRKVRREMIKELSGHDPKSPMFHEGDTRKQALWASAVNDFWNEADGDDEK